MVQDLFHYSTKTETRKLFILLTLNHVLLCVHNISDSYITLLLHDPIAFTLLPLPHPPMLSRTAEKRPRRTTLPLWHCHTAPMLHAAPEMLQLTLNERQTNTQCHKALGTGLSQGYHKSNAETTAADIPRDGLSQFRSAQVTSHQWVKTKKRSSLRDRESKNVTHRTLNISAHLWFEGFTHFCGSK